MKKETSHEKLAQWLAEWELDQTLSFATEEPLLMPEKPSHGTALSIGQTGESLAEGDIVLLPPYGPFTTMRPVYVALVAQLENDRWEVVPFSRYSVPATEREWSTGRDAEPLKVLCPWNRGQLDTATLLAGWKAEHLTDKEEKWLRESLNGMADKALQERCGPPLVHPLDPRHDYLEEERALWFDNESEEYAKPPWFEDAIPRAAEKKKNKYK